MTALVVGDSLTEQSREALERWADDSGQRVVILAENGRSLRSAPRYLEGWPSATRVVVALGTNDVSVAAATLDAWIDDALAACPPTAECWWVDVYIADGRGAEVNAAIDRARTRHPTLGVLSWAAVARAHPEALAPDGIHLTDRGARLRADLLAEVLEIPSGTPPPDGPS